MGWLDYGSGWTEKDNPANADERCLLCEEDPVDCLCPECPLCETVGDPACSINGGKGCSPANQERGA